MTDEEVVRESMADEEIARKKMANEQIAGPGDLPPRTATMMSGLSM